MLYLINGSHSCIERKANLFCSKLSKKKKKNMTMLYTVLLFSLSQNWNEQASSCHCIFTINRIILVWQFEVGVFSFTQFTRWPGRPYADQTLVPQRQIPAECDIQSCAWWPGNIVIKSSGSRRGYIPTSVIETVQYFSTGQELCYFEEQVSHYICWLMSLGFNLSLWFIETRNRSKIMNKKAILWMSTQQKSSL